MKFRLYISLFFLITLWAGSSNSAPRVVSAGICADTLTLSVADPSQIIALTKAAADVELSPYIDKVQKGKAHTVSFEEMFLEKPEMVIVDEFTPDMTIDVYKRLGFKIFKIPPLKTFDDVKKWQEKLAVILEQEKPRAFTIPVAQKQKNILASVYRPGGYSPGRFTNVDYILKLAGYKNLASELALEGAQTISLETLIYYNPELLITDAALEGKYKNGFAQMLLRHNAISEKIDKSLYIPLARWFCLNPRSIYAFRRVWRYYR